LGARDDLQELLGADRLDKVQVEAGLPSAFAILWLPVPRERHETKRTELPRGTECPGHRITVHARKPDVQQHELRPKNAQQPSYLLNDGSIVHLTLNEYSVGQPTPRLELTFTKTGSPKH
jgi:hypothetical protein